MSTVLYSGKKIKIGYVFICRMMNQESSKKRSKLVLPSPQVTEAELEEVCTLTSNIISYLFVFSSII